MPRKLFGWKSGRPKYAKFHNWRVFQFTRINWLALAFARRPLWQCLMWSTRRWRCVKCKGETMLLNKGCTSKRRLHCLLLVTHPVIMPNQLLNICISHSLISLFTRWLNWYSVRFKRRCRGFAATLTQSLWRKLSNVIMSSRVKQMPKNTDIT